MYVKDAYGPIPTGDLSGSPFVMVKWNPCGAEASHFSYWNSVGGMPPGVMGGSGDDISSKVPMSSITLIDRNFNPGDRVSKYRRVRLFITCALFLNLLHTHENNAKTTQKTHENTD